MLHMFQVYNKWASNLLYSLNIEVACVSPEGRNMFQVHKNENCVLFLSHALVLTCLVLVLKNLSATWVQTPRVTPKSTTRISANLGH